MSRSSTILLIETATSACSVAVTENGKVLAVAGRNEPNIHAGLLTVFIEEVLQASARSFSDLTAVAVSSGPGSYTGLRIGVSTAKGLCYALDIPLIAVDTIRAMANGYISKNDLSKEELLVPMIDARRMEVYTAVYDHQLNIREAVSAKIIDPLSFEAYRGNNLVLLGDGAGKLAETFAGRADIRIGNYENSAESLAAEAESKFSRGEFENVAYFEPFYLKDFVATTPKKVI